MLAVSANESPRKNVVEDLLLAARRPLVLFVDGVHLIPDLLGDDGREDIVIRRSLMFDFSDISLVVKNDIDIFLIDELAILPSDIAFLQIVGDGFCFETLRIFSEYLPHGVGFRFIDDILLVLDNISERRDAARGVAFEPTLPQAAVDLLPQILRIIFVEAFDDRLKEFAFGCIGDILHRRDQTDAVIGELLAVDDRLIHIAGKPIEFVNDDDAPLSSFVVREHLLKCRAVVVRSRGGAVDVFVHHKEIVLFRILLADVELTFDGLLRLRIARITGIDYCCFQN